jgi:hypothetical protein
MKRIGIVGLSVVAMFAFSAMAASSAFAGEYITCVKVAKVEKKYKGKYSNNACSTLSSPAESGKYERGTPAFPIAVTSKSKTAELLSAAGHITCKASTGVGSLLSSKTDLEETKFTECVLSLTGGKCVNLSTFEETGKYLPSAITSWSATTLIDNGEKGPSGDEPAPGEVWNSFAPDASAPVYPFQAVYICEPGVIFRTSGTTSSVVTPVLAKPSTKGVQTFIEGKGEQDLNTEFSENGGETWESTGPNVEMVTGDTKTASDVEVADGTP